MNDFTRDELQQIKFDMDMGQNRFDASFTDEMYSALERKLQSMIDNYKDDPWNTWRIAESHLSEAESLISHAMSLLGMKNE